MLRRSRSQAGAGKHWGRWWTTQTKQPRELARCRIPDPLWISGLDPKGQKCYLETEAGIGLSKESQDNGAPERDPVAKKNK